MRCLALLVLTLAIAAEARAADIDPLRDDLRALAAVDGPAGKAMDDMVRYRRVWVALASLPAHERAPWERTLVAVLNRLGQLSRVDQDTPRGRPAQAAARDELDRAEAYYRALRRACGDDAAAPLVGYIDRALTVTLRRKAMKISPDARGPAMEEVIRRDIDSAAAYRDAGDAAMEALVLADLSFSLFAVGREAEATPWRQRAVERFESLPEDFLEIVDLELDEPLDRQVAAWARLGYEAQEQTYLLYALEKYNAGLKDPASMREAIHLYTESLRLGVLHGNTTAVNNVGALLIMRGIGDETGRGRRIRFLHDVLATLADPQANPHWQGRGPLRAVDEAVNWVRARASEYLGEFYSETGQLLLARHHLDEAGRYAEQLQDEAILPLVLSTKAALLARIGLLDESIRTARQALDARETGLKQRSGILLLMGSVEQQRGDYGRAGDYYRWAWDLFVKPGSFQIDRDDIPSLARIRRAQADLELAQGRFREAVQALEETGSLAALEDTEQALADHAEALRLAQAQLRPERFHPSPELLAALHEAPPAEFVALARTRGAGGRVRVAQWESRVAVGANGQAPSSALSAQQVEPLRRRFLAAEVSGEAPAEPDDARLRELWAEARPGFKDSYLAGRVALALGELPEAAERFEEALTVHWKTAAEDLDPALGIESPQRVRQMHHEAALVQIRLGHPAEALAILDMARHHALLSTWSSGQSLWDRFTPAERDEASRLDDSRTRAAQRVLALTTEAASDGRRNQQDLDAAQRGLVEAEAQWLAYKTRLRTLYRLPSPPRQPLSAEAMAALAGDGEAILTYSVGEHETCVVAVRRDGEDVRFVGRELPIRAGDLEVLVEALRLGASQPGAAYEVLSGELYRILLAPLDDVLEPARMLAVAPDGSLNNLSFALLADEQGRLLLERVPLVRLTSLEQLRRLRDAAAPGPREGLLLVDLREFGDRAWLPSSYAGQLSRERLRDVLPRYQLAPLENTAAEADRIAALFAGRAERLSDARAREPAVVAAAAGKRFVHFATHGLVDAYNPFQSVLVLAAPAAGDSEDGFLEAAEILESSSFSGAELVTLSACESGLGLVQGTEGVLGLTWAFLAAGNRAVLASFWSVDDAATAELTVAFYRALLDGRNKAQALREAALALKSTLRTAHPAYWAPFQITGDWTFQQ